MSLAPHPTDATLPFFVVPCLEKPKLEGSYTITVLSDREVRLERATTGLVEARS